MRRTYDPTAERYREDDDFDISRRDHQRVCKTICSLCSEFEGPIHALDLGCGTGRYFHCLRNVHRLVGMDVSGRMLEQAINPVRREEISADSIELLQGNIYTAAFPVESFHLVYSIGVFGNGCQPTPELCDAVYSWLKPGGKFFFDTADTSDLPPAVLFRKKVRNAIRGALPGFLQAAWDKRTGWMPFFLTSEKELRHLLGKTRFTDIEVVPRTAQLTVGPGRKLECILTK